MPKVSVIIPAYNAERFLANSVESVLSQSFRDFELIIIDDGSTDKTLTICENYAQRDNRVIILHQKNQGVMVARKKGIEVASGEYICWVDADDWLEVNALEELYEFAEKERSDMVIYDFYEHKDGSVSEIHSNINIKKPEEIIKSIFVGATKGVLWNKLIRRTLFISPNMLYPKNIQLLEDVFINVEILLNNMECIKVNYLNKPFYHYERNVNPHSITMDKNSRFNLSADGILLNFRKLLLPYPHLWNTWVEFEMPWISYLCLYYHSFDAHRFKEEFHYLLDKDLRDVNALVKLALKNYFIASMLMKCRRMFSILLHK